MAIESGFFNSVNGDRKYTAEQIGRFLQGIVSSGVYADKSDSLQVMATDGMQVEVQPGRAMLDFHYLNNDSPLVLTLNNGGTQDRIDAIVAYLDMSNRVCDIKVKTGTAAASPVAPTMERSSTLKEYMLAVVRVAKYATTITQSSITDTRADSSVCGWVTGVIDQVDTSTLFLQWQAAYEEALLEFDDYLDAQKAAWESFFANVTEDNVLPAPALHDAGKAVIVNDTADGYKIKGFPTANLLDNGNFINPINQRGASHYTSPADGYAIDRWKCPADGTVRVQSGYIELVSSKTSGRLTFQQLIPLEKITVGKKYTFAVKVKGGDIYTAVCEFGERDYTYEHTKISDTCGISVITASTNNVYTDIRAGIRFEGASSIALEWAALYEGEYSAENLPAYQPKGYAAELLECQRYFIGNVGPGATGFYLANSNQFRALIPTPVTMRAVPTVSMVSKDSIVSNVSGTTVAATVSDVAVSNLFNNGVTVTLATNATPGSYAPGTLYSGFNLSLSADL